MRRTFLQSVDQFIPVAIPDLSTAEEAYVLDAIRSTWISSSGAYVNKFEEIFSECCRTPIAISVVNGTAALHLALLGLGIQPNDEIIIPSMTYIATANAVRYTQAHPVFVDVDPNTWCIDPELIEPAITKRTRGIIAVDLYGHPADFDRITEIAAKYGLWVLEDAAEAHFAAYKGRPTGSLANASVFSFFGNKIITCGEGGAITTSDTHLEQRLRLLRNQGMDPQRRYFFPVIGYNYRLTNVACALLCAQLERRAHLISRRRAIYERYTQNLSGIEGLALQPHAPWAEVTPWLFSVTIDHDGFGRSRDEVMATLLEQRIETRPFFIPIHLLPPYLEEHGSFPQSERLGATGINLPTFTGMTDTQIDRICQILLRAHR